MARRVVNGSTHTENGWPIVDTGSCTWDRIPGAEHVSLQFQNGPPRIVMRAFAADFHMHVEPLRDHDSACWTKTNDVLGGFGKNNGSNHLGGTGMDLNWQGPDGKTFRYGISKQRAYPPPKDQLLQELLDFYEGNIFCGGEWTILDWMHFQMGYGTYDSKNDRPSEKVLDFIERKIRPDGFSTFKKGGAAGLNKARLLADAMGNEPGVDYEKLLPYAQDCLRKSGCKTNNQIAMWCAQIGHESSGLKHMKEIGDAAYFAKYNNRPDLGNGPTDGPRYPGRGPIQVTGRNNYRRLSEWAHKEGYVPTPTYFEDSPAELEKYEYAFLGAVWYWKVAQPNINPEADKGNVDIVSKLINMPANAYKPNIQAHGAQHRRDRWNRTRNMNLLPLIEEDDPLAGVDVDRLNRAIDKILGGGTMPELWHARGMFAPAEDTFGGVDDTVGMLLNADANAWNIVMIIGALLGIERDVKAIRDNAQGKFPKGMHEGNAWRKQRAQEFAQKLLPLCGLLSPAGLGFSMEEVDEQG